MTLSIQTEFDKLHIDHSRENEVYLRISLKAPKVETDRQPIALLATVDVSGSMGYDRKIQKTQSSLKNLVKNLTEIDRLGIVTFNHQTNTRLDLCKMDREGRKKALEKVNHLQASGNTNISGAIDKASTVLLNGDIQPNVRQRIILLTDGQPTSGITDPKTLLNLADNLPQVQTMSTMGFGPDHDALLLSDMARKARGNFYYIEETDSAPRAFGSELGGLLNSFAQNIRLKITPAPNVELVKCLNPFELTENTLEVPDLYSEEEQNIILKFKLPRKSTAVLTRPNRVCNIEIEYLDSKTALIKKPPVIKPKIRYVRPNLADTQQNPIIREQIALLEAARVQRQAVVLAREGHEQQALGHLRQVLTDLEALTDPSPEVQYFCGEVAEFIQSIHQNTINNTTLHHYTAMATSYSRRRSADAGNHALSAQLDTGAVQNMMDKFENVV